MPSKEAASSILRLLALLLLTCNCSSNSGRVTKLPSPRTAGRHDVLLDKMSVKLHDEEDVVAMLHVVSSNSRGVQERAFILFVMMTMSVY